MPLLKLETTVALPEYKREALLGSLSKAVAEIIGKPEQYVMVTLSQAAILMAGKPEPAAFVDVRSIGGLKPSINLALSKKICELLRPALGVAMDRIYLNFANVEGDDWG